MILKPDDHPALFPGKMQKLYALDHIHRVSVVCLFFVVFVVVFCCCFVVVFILYYIHAVND